MTHSDPTPSHSHSPSTAASPVPSPSPAPTSADASAHADAIAADGAANPQQNQHEGGDANDPVVTKKRLSTGMGAAFLAGGVLGLAVPGLPGWPLIIIGASVLAPRVPILARANDWMKERFPDAHAGALHFEHRFLTDLEKRYPEKAPSPASEPSTPVESGPETKNVQASGTVAAD